MQPISCDAFPFGFTRTIDASSPLTMWDWDSRRNHLAATTLVPSEEKLRMLQCLLHMANHSCSRSQLNSAKSITIPLQVGSPSPCEKRYSEQLRARVKLARIKERKAQFANCPPSSTQIGKQARRISALTETVPAQTVLARTFPTPAQDAEGDDDNSTICIPVNYHSPQDFGELDCDDIDEIFDDESTCDDDSVGKPCEQVVPQPEPTSPTTPALTGQVSEASFCRLLRNRRRDSSPRNPSPKEAGFSSWDDVSSIATLSRLGSFEPEPLPMGDCPIPVIIYVPTSKDEGDDLDPLRIFAS